MCSKQGFTKKECQTILNQNKFKNKKKYRKECRFYYCKECNTYHLTSDEEYNERVYLTEKDLVFQSQWDKLKGG